MKVIHTNDDSKAVVRVLKSGKEILDSVVGCLSYSVTNTTTVERRMVKVGKIRYLGKS